MAEKVTDVVSGKIETTVTEQTTSEKEKLFLFQRTVLWTHNV